MVGGIVAQTSFDYPHFSCN